MDLSGVVGDGTLGKSNAEQERPYLAAKSGKDRAYKAGGLKFARSREGVREVRITEEGCKTTRWREGALLGSGWTGGKCEGMPETANTPYEKVRQLPRKL